ncbi:MAG: class I SAM-dependent methyltransferase [Burkholderiaceae bacterium]
MIPANHAQLAASTWVKRWGHLVAPKGKVLDIACGNGRHMQWFAQQGHPVLGIDRSAEALTTAANWGQTVLADIENAPWPLVAGGHAQLFDAVVVTNYLWRALFPVLAQSLAPGGILIYETFSQGNETVGKPSRADFLLRQSELLSAFPDLEVLAFEQGFLEQPERFVQRLVAVRPNPALTDAAPVRYRL